MKGKVYFVGAGPGDPGLITVRGARLLREADAVVYDRLIHPDLVAMAGRARKIYAGKRACLAGRRAGRESGTVPQMQINRLLVRLARSGKTVVRLKGGDPFVFGRGGEEAGYLRENGVPYEVVPGVSAGHAVPAYAGIPVTDRRHASLVTFVTAHEGASKKRGAVEWEKLARLGGTLVCFMGAGTLREMADALAAAGMPARTPVVIIEGGTLPGQRVVEGTLRTIASRARKAGIGSPALTVVGEVGRLRRELAWFETRPLAGKTVAITRPKSQAPALREALEEEGARVLELPAIEIRPPRSWAGLDRALRRLERFDWLVFTSVHGVQSFFQRLDHAGRDARALGKIKIAVIGEATGEALGRFGLKADLTPPHYTSADLAAALGRTGDLRGRRFLLPRADIASAELREGLLKRGAAVTEVTAYRTVGSAEGRRKMRRILRKGRVDYITFTSASTVKQFSKMVPPRVRRMVPARLVSIGPVTTAALRQYGFQPHREAAEHTAAGVVRAITRGEGRQGRLGQGREAR